MSGNVAPKIVRDSSLVLCLDAANTKSFQVGTIKWLDLSGDKLNATLYSGATYSSLNGGCISNVIFLTLVSWLYYKEPLTTTQIVGMVLGTSAVIFLEQ